MIPAAGAREELPPRTRQDLRRLCQVSAILIQYFNTNVSRSSGNCLYLLYLMLGKDHDNDNHDI